MKEIKTFPSFKDNYPDYINNEFRKCKYCGSNAKYYEGPIYSGDKILIYAGGYNIYRCDCEDAKKFEEIEKQKKELEQQKPKYKYNLKTIFDKLI